MIYVEVLKAQNGTWLAIEPKTGRSDFSTSVRSAVENLLLKYDLIGIKAVVTKIVDSDGSETVTYHKPGVSVTINQDQLA